MAQIPANQPADSPPWKITAAKNAIEQAAKYHSMPEYQPMMQAAHAELGAPLPYMNYEAPVSSNYVMPVPPPSLANVATTPNPLQTVPSSVLTGVQPLPLATQMGISGAKPTQ